VTRTLAKERDHQDYRPARSPFFGVDGTVLTWTSREIGNRHGGRRGAGGSHVRRLAGLGAGVAILDQAGDRAAELAKEVGDTVVAVGGDVDDDVGTAIAAAQSVGTLSVVDRSRRPATDVTNRPTLCRWPPA
jgi:hypothetical protein